MFWHRHGSISLTISYLLILPADPEILQFFYLPIWIHVHIISAWSVRQPTKNIRYLRNVIQVHIAFRASAVALINTQLLPIFNFQHDQKLARRPGSRLFTVVEYHRWGTGVWVLTLTIFCIEDWFGLNSGKCYAWFVNKIPMTILS
jgi:hypothetical protein